MQSHPLISEKMITLSPTLAATIGLEEAVMLTWLNDMMLSANAAPLKLANDIVRRQLPFWNDQQIRLAIRSLHEKGIIQLQSALFPDDDCLVVSFSNGAAEASEIPVQAQTSPSHAVNQTTSNQPVNAQWTPAASTLSRLQQHGVPDSFCWANMDAFILQAQEKGRGRNDWNTQFFRYMKKQWVYQQSDAFQERKKLESEVSFPTGQAAKGNKSADPHQRFHMSQPAQPQSMAGQWAPSEDAVQILQRSGIKPDFIQDAVAEFVLYWQERGDAHNTWNTKFIQHVRTQWARFSSSLEHSTTPTRITEQWQPSKDCFDILAMAHIDTQFAAQLIPEFILYWKDSNQMLASWNSKFLQYVKQKWAQRLNNPSSAPQSAQGNQYGTQQPSVGSNYTTAEASIQRLSDTSWAD